MIHLAVATCDTPIGPFTVLVDAEGSVRASAWRTTTERLQAWLPEPSVIDLSTDIATPVVAAVERYWQGDVAALDDVAVSQREGAFIAVARRELRRVPAGTTISYTELARRAGNERAARAAASACAKNTVPGFVPCHRVVRGDGSLGGFAFGLDAKRTLLAHEREHAR